MAPCRDLHEKLAEVAQKFLRKGAKVYLEGQLTTRKWTDQSGQERYTTEVVVPRFGGTTDHVDGRAGGGEGGGGGAWTTAATWVGWHGGGSAPSGGGRPAARGGKPELDDDIPF